MSIDPMTIVFALVAMFVGWRLWSVLGTRTGVERPPMQAPRAGAAATSIDMTPNPPPPPAERWKGVAEPGGPLARGLDAVAAADPDFDAPHFLAGARAAYEMIIDRLRRRQRRGAARACSRRSRSPISPAPSKRAGRRDAPCR